MTALDGAMSGRERGFDPGVSVLTKSLMWVPLGELCSPSDNTIVLDFNPSLTSLKTRVNWWFAMDYNKKAEKDIYVKF